MPKAEFDGTREGDQARAASDELIAKVRAIHTTPPRRAKQIDAVAWVAMSAAGAALVVAIISHRRAASREAFCENLLEALADSPTLDLPPAFWDALCQRLGAGLPPRSGT